MPGFQTRNQARAQRSGVRSLSERCLLRVEEDVSGMGGNEGQGICEKGQDEMSSIDDIIAEREKTHGKFTEHAEITQSLKRVMHGKVRWGDLLPDQQEALDMVVHKIGRILAGDPDLEDHWRDMEGYCKLVADRLRVCGNGK